MRRIEEQRVKMVPPDDAVRAVEIRFRSRELLHLADRVDLAAAIHLFGALV